MGSNLDIRHINYLNANRYLLDIKDYYFSLNCIVQYKGLRVHAQVVTPGVIFNSEHLVEYGEAEEGLVKNNEEFHKDYIKLCDKLNIRPVSVTDKNGVVHELAAHPEIKGVRGIDKRKYLFDLIHLFPRDLNYIGPGQSGCLLRPELIKEYQSKLIYQKISSEYNEELKKINSDVEAYFTESKDQSNYIKFVEEKYKRKEEVFEKINNEIKPLIKINTTLETENKYLKYSAKTDEEDREFLNSLAKLLKEDIITKFLNEINKEDELLPSDSFSLTENLHKRGINIRYLGFILEKIQNDNNYKKNCAWVKNLILRDVIRRCAKHIYNSFAIEVPDYLLKDFTAHFLNLLLSPGNVLKQLDKLEIHYVNNILTLNKQGSNTAQESNINTSTIVKENKDKKKKNKNKKKKTDKNVNNGPLPASSNNSESIINIKSFVIDSISNTEFSNTLFDSQNNDKYFLTPSAFWNKIQNIAKTRYNVSFNESTIKEFDFIETSMNKFGLLRDFCLTVGFQIEGRDYALYNDFIPSKNETLKYSSLPFNKNDICHFFSVCKDYQMPSDIHKPIFDQAETLFKAENILEATEKFRQILYLSNEILGPINYYSGISNKRLADIACIQGDYLNGIAMLQKAIITFEKMLNYDSSFIANCYTELSTYYHFLGQDYFSFKYIKRALEIINYIYPKNVRIQKLILIF